ncbi:hypothetical protein [Vibrio hannami]|uniref:hypothetical protein n=1 Tax=Vibrio hannami TaxID=2717094 RepID=UPI003EBB7901
MNIGLLLETLCLDYFERNIESTTLTALAVEGTVDLTKLFISVPNLRGGLIKELIISEFQGCSAMLAKQNKLDAHALMRLVRRECFPSARLALDNNPELFNQLFGMQSAVSKDYYLTPDVEIEFRAYCMSLARKVPVHQALRPGKPDIDGVLLWLMLGTLYVIVHVKV